ncbi:hypothetical protein GQ37_019750 [Janthinobacterium sp. BJB1]|nr:hypothetical protein CSQ90_20590 [Janthinobacterium sp. BJB303]PJC96898.1 hypothetical protein GQ37_019750 [Janthinobacterium sp. BJB1]
MAAAQAQISDATLRGLSACDASFFRSLQQDGAALAGSVPLATRGDASWIKVPNRNQAQAGSIEFAAPVRAGGVTLLGYTDEVSDLGSLGRYYSWAFLVAGKVDAVYRQLQPLIHDARRMRADDGAYVRSDVRLPGGPWQAFASASGVAAGRDKVERVFLIEPHGELDGVVRVGCSLQGGVDAALLREARPDIDASEYPPPPNATGAFDSAPLPPGVLAAAQAAMAAAPVWQPRFKTLSSSRESTTPGKPGEASVVDQEWRVRDGLVVTSENYSAFTMQRVKLAGLFQLRAAEKGDVRNGYLATSGLSLSLPASLSPGTRFQANMTTINVPAKPGERPEQVTTLCEVQDTLQASTISASLQGAATRFVCTSQESGYVVESALLHDLGVAMQLRTVSKAHGESHYRYLNLQITK